jgi:GNAT superfamily N-acetyltransferase
MDMLVKLYDLPLSFDFVGEMAKKGVTIRKPIGPERPHIAHWITEEAGFSAGWASEFEVTMGKHPFTSFIATEKNELIGFACYDATALGFLGPVGVREDKRGRGVGRALLLACLQEMKLKGYGYAAIGWVGAPEFYEKACGAIPIPESHPGIYGDLLRS